MKKIFIILGIIIIALGGVWLWFLFKCEDDWCFLFNWQWTHRTASTPPPINIKESNIKVFLPKPNDEIGQELIIKGEARVFENQFAWRVRDADGAVLANGSGYANAPDVGQFGPFEIKTSYLWPKGKTGTVEVFNYSPKDGVEIDMVRVVVRFK